MSDLDLMRVPAKPPLVDKFGEPQVCPRCGGIYERPFDSIAGHQIGHPKLCPPMLNSTIKDARERKSNRRAQR